MDKKEREQLKPKIADKIAKLELDIVQLKLQSQPISPENAIGRISRMDAINNKSVIEAALRNSERKLEGLKRALERINDPDFGKCSKCGRPLQAGRMLVMPESLHCVNCA
jgi:DnaK suppressor protein